MAILVPGARPKRWLDIRAGFGHTRAKTAKLDAEKLQGLDREALLRIYRTMYLSRRMDDREIQP